MPVSKLNLLINYDYNVAFHLATSKTNTAKLTA